MNDIFESVNPTQVVQTLPSYSGFLFGLPLYKYSLLLYITFQCLILTPSAFNCSNDSLE